MGLCNIGGVLRSHPVTDFLKFRIGHPHFRVHYSCKFLVLFWYFSLLFLLRAQIQSAVYSFDCYCPIQILFDCHWPKFYCCYYNPLVILFLLSLPVICVVWFANPPIWSLYTISLLSSYLHCCHYCTNCGSCVLHLFFAASLNRFAEVPRYYAKLYVQLPWYLQIRSHNTVFKSTWYGTQYLSKQYGTQ